MRDGRKLLEPQLRDAKIISGFFSEYQRLLVEKMIPYQMGLFLDGGGFDALKRAAGYRVPEREEPEQGVDFGKLLEAVAYGLMLRDDEKLRKTTDEVVAVMRQAQLADGYLNPRMTYARQRERLLSLTMSHELYGLGHTMEGLMCYHQATGNETALETAKGIGDCLCLWFGPEEGQIHGYDGHPGVEMALYRLYRYTGERKYFDVMKYFVDERGTKGPDKPHFFDWEQQRNREKYGKPVLGDLASWADAHRPYWHEYEYFQAHRPARELTEPTGHAVRATYFYSAMADVALEAGDEELFQACRRVWEGIEGGNLYINGSIGQDCFWEGIGKAYDLPPDVAYNETCAAIGLIFFAQRMLKLDPSAHYADVMERALYNTVLAGVGLDGEHYFYCNPLEMWPDALYRFSKDGNTLARRFSWHICACCPPNVARLLGELAQFAYLSDGDSIWANLYLSGETGFQMDCGRVALRQKTGYPWDDTVRFEVRGAGKFTLRLRIPGWCRGASLSINGVERPVVLERGYAVVTENWREGDRVELVLPMPCRREYANPKVYQEQYQVAVARGPILYCAEEADNGPLLSGLTLPRESTLKDRWEPGLLGGVWTISAQGRRPATGEGPLYSETPPQLRPCDVKLVPYYAWANREPGEMRVYLHETR